MDGTAARLGREQKAQAEASEQNAQQLAVDLEAEAAAVDASGLAARKASTRPRQRQSSDLAGGCAASAWGRRRIRGRLT